MLRTSAGGLRTPSNSRGSKRRILTAALVSTLLASVLAFLPEFASNLDYWTEKAPTPDAIGIGTTPANAAVLDGKIYTVAQGDMLEIYDPATDSWTRGPKCPSELLTWP